MLFHIFPDSGETLLKAFFEAYIRATSFRSSLAIQPMFLQVLRAPHLNPYFRSRERANDMVKMMETKSLLQQIPYIYLRYVNDFLRGDLPGTHSPINLNKSYLFEHEVKTALTLAREKLYDDFRELLPHIREQIVEFTSVKDFLQWSAACLEEGLGMPDKHWPLPHQDVLMTMTFQGHHYYIFKNTYTAEVLIRATVDALYQEKDRDVCDLPPVLEWKNVILSPEQRNIINTILRLRFGIVIGFPGVGKTTVLSYIYSVENNQHTEETGQEEEPQEKKGSYQIGTQTLFMCPFNKAKVRAINLGIETAITIDSFIALGNFHPKTLTSRYHQVDRIIIDESSVLNARVLSELLNTCKLLIHHDRLSLILVGDPDQLPPIQSGSVFVDLIHAFPDRVHSLSQVYRTDAKNLLGLYESMRAGTYQVHTPDPSDMSLVVYGDEEKALEHYNFTESCIVIAYTNKQVKKFNEYLRDKHIKFLHTQRQFTPLPIRHYGKTYFKREKLVATANCRDCGVFKGMTGIIRDNAGLSSPGQCLHKKHILVYVDGSPFSTVTCVNVWNNGYAITSHKSQGSEWSKVIAAYPFFLPFISQQSVYTAVTRGKNQVILLTNGQTWSRLCKNKVDLQDGTLLKIIHDIQVTKLSFQSHTARTARTAHTEHESTEMQKLSQMYK